MAIAAPLSNWQAVLNLAFEKRGKRSVLSKNEHQGPLLVQKPFYPEGNDVCHVYLLHPPGGVVQGDNLAVNISLNKQSHALITTPAASKFYRSNNRKATLKQHIQVDTGSKIEWLPQETLLFNDSNVELSTIIDLKGSARFIGWEMLCLGRKASSEEYTSGLCRQAFEIYRDGKAIFIERTNLSGGDPLLTSQWGLAGLPVSATMVATNCDHRHIKLIHNYLQTLTIEDQISATLKNDLLICRFLGNQAEHARKYFIQIWKLIRSDLMGKDITIPRIWNT
jgi:urease accessory protein